MAVVIETTLGDITIDLFIEERPTTCMNFLKLCRIKYYNFCLFHSVQQNFIAQSGDPIGTGHEGHSIFFHTQGKESKYYEAEKMPKLKHSNIGTVSMVNCGNHMLGSQFFITLGKDLQSLDGEHCVFGEVAEGHEVIRKFNEVICDQDHRPYQDIRITHTVILEDPFDDPPGLQVPDCSPELSKEALANSRIAPDEEIDETAGLTAEEIEELQKSREAQAQATILEIVGDLPDANVAPPENVLFVCKLNPVTTDDDLEIIFSRFGKIVSCEVIRDKTTGDSLQYAFVEFDNRKACEDAFFKMDNVLIDDRRIHVDFSQSVSKLRWKGKGRGVEHLDDGNPIPDYGNYDRKSSKSKRHSPEDIRNSYSDASNSRYRQNDKRKPRNFNYQTSSPAKYSSRERKYQDSSNERYAQSRDREHRQYNDYNNREEQSKYESRNLERINSSFERFKNNKGEKSASRNLEKESKQRYVANASDNEGIHRNNYETHTQRKGRNETPSAEFKSKQVRKEKRKYSSCSSSEGDVYKKKYRTDSDYENERESKRNKIQKTKTKDGKINNEDFRRYKGEKYRSEKIRGTETATESEKISRKKCDNRKDNQNEYGSKVSSHWDEEEKRQNPSKSKALDCKSIKGYKQKEVSNSDFEDEKNSNLRGKRSATKKLKKVHPESGEKHSFKRKSRMLKMKSKRTNDKGIRKPKVKSKIVDKEEKMKKLRKKKYDTSSSSESSESSSSSNLESDTSDSETSSSNSDSDASSESSSDSSRSSSSSTTSSSDRYDHKHKHRKKLGSLRVGAKKTKKKFLPPKKSKRAPKRSDSSDVESKRLREKNQNKVNSTGNVKDEDTYTRSKLKTRKRKTPSSADSSDHFYNSDSSVKLRKHHRRVSKK